MIPRIIMSIMISDTETVFRQFPYPVKAKPHVENIFHVDSP